LSCGVAIFHSYTSQKKKKKTPAPLKKKKIKKKQKTDFKGKSGKARKGR